MQPYTSDIENNSF